MEIKKGIQREGMVVGKGWGGKKEKKEGRCTAG